MPGKLSVSVIPNTNNFEVIETDPIYRLGVWPRSAAERLEKLEEIVKMMSYFELGRPLVRARENGLIDIDMASWERFQELAREFAIEMPVPQDKKDIYYRIESNE